MTNEQIDRLKRMAMNAGGIPFTQVFDGVAFPDDALERFARAIAEECATVCGEMADADFSADDCEMAIRKLYREQT
jgi:hypothetical protein